MTHEPARPRGRGPLLRLVSAVVVLGLVVGVVALAVGGREAYRPTAPDEVVASAVTARPGPAGSTLAALVSALEAGDADAAAALAAPGDDAAAGRLADVVANARALRLALLSARYVDALGPVADDGSWTASVALTWRVPGVDERAARAEVAVRFVPADDGSVRLGDLAAPGERAPLWWSERLSVARSGDAVVAVAGDDDAARAWLRRVETGTGVVRRVLPDWDGAAMVEVPATAGGVDRALDVPEGTYAAVAAVTAPVGDARGPGAPVHVLVNPDVVASLRPAGVQVVTSHELAHVATDATRGSLPTWLLEGFADYVALRDVELPVSITAGRAAALVRAGGVPARLPGDADLDPAAPDLDAAYEMAWLACVTLADRAGEQGLLRVYDTVRTGTPLASALAEVGLDEPTLTAAWRSRLRELAR